MRILYCASFLLLLTACFLRREFAGSRFFYTQSGKQASLPLLVPKGYVKEERNDTAGVSLRTFLYPSGAILYAAFLTDTTVELQSFDKSLHQPKPFTGGGLVYKGQDEKEKFYREVRQGHLRFGYRNVPEEQEWQFDSSTNYAGLQKR